MTQFISRAYNTFEIDSKTQAVIVKKSTESRLEDEINYYKNVPTGLSVYFPRLLYSNIEENKYEAGMEYYAYDNLGNLMINDNFNPEIWKKVVDFLFTFINNSKEYKISKENSADSIAMYIEKTENEKINKKNDEDFDLMNEDKVILTDKDMKLK